MKRLHLFEWEDLPWFPHTWRNYMTDLLRTTFTWQAPRAKGVVHVLARLLERMQTDTILDLCSGSTGPLLWFREKLEEQRGGPVRVVLTDKYPNLEVFRAARAASDGRVEFRADPIDARKVPPDLPGVRTLFLAFHHFRPEDARGILEDATRHNRAIAVFDSVERSAIAFIFVLTLPLIVLLATPFVRPVRAGRLIWTYVVPVIPVCVLWDGLVSCLRAYNPAELRQLGETIPADYEWEAGRLKMEGLPAWTTYLAGYPRRAP